MKQILAAASLCLIGLPGWGQSPPTAAASQPAAAPTPGLPQRGGEPQVKRIVTEDDAVRIDELRVRGITRKVTVQPKLPGAPAYEIGSAGDGRDVSQDRRSEGRSLWQLFSF